MLLYYHVERLYFLSIFACMHTPAGLDQERQIKMPNILIYCLALSKQNKVNLFTFPKIS